MAITITREDARGMEPVPVGTYECQIDEVNMRPSKSSGALCYYISYTIDEGEHADRLLFDNVSTLVGWKVAELLKATEYNEFGDFLDSGDDEAGLDEEAVLEHLESYTGRLSIRVKHEEFEGEPRAKVARVRPSTAKAVDRLLDQVQLPEDEIPL